MFAAATNLDGIISRRSGSDDDNRNFPRRQLVEFGIDVGRRDGTKDDRVDVLREHVFEIRDLLRRLPLGVGLHVRNDIFVMRDFDLRFFEGLHDPTVPDARRDERDLVRTGFLVGSRDGLVGPARFHQTTERVVVEIVDLRLGRRDERERARTNDCRKKKLARYSQAGRPFITLRALRRGDVHRTTSRQKKPFEKEPDRTSAIRTAFQMLCRRKHHSMRARQLQVVCVMHVTRCKLSSAFGSLW